MDNLITLPSGAKWDNEKNLYAQDSDALQFAQYMFDNLIPVEQKDSFGRPVLVIWEDNLVRIEQQTTYKHPGTDRFSWEPLTSQITLKLK